MAENILLGPETTAYLAHRDRLVGLAELKKECPRCNGLGSIPTSSRDIQPDPCENCGGTGKVFRFPMLRQLREYHQDCLPFGFCNLDAIRKAELGDCQGRGFVPVDNERATLEALASVSFEVRLSKYLSRWSPTIYQGSHALPWGDAEDAYTPNGAFVEALYKVMRRKED